MNWGIFLRKLLGIHKHNFYSKTNKVKFMLTQANKNHIPSIEGKSIIVVGTGAGAGVDKVAGAGVGMGAGAGAGAGVFEMMKQSFHFWIVFKS